MNRLAEESAAAEVPEGSVRLPWLGQAGFAFKTPSPVVIYVDPCLSDASTTIVHTVRRVP